MFEDITENKNIEGQSDGISTKNSSTGNLYKFGIEPFLLGLPKGNSIIENRYCKAFCDSMPGNS